MYHVHARNSQRSEKGIRYPGCKPPCKFRDLNSCLMQELLRILNHRAMSPVLLFIFNLCICFYLLSTSLSLSLSMWVCVCATVYGGQRTTIKSWMVRVPGIELRLLGLAFTHFTHWAILPVLKFYLWFILAVLFHRKSNKMTNLFCPAMLEVTKANLDLVMD